VLREKMVYMSVGDSHHNQGNHGESFALTRRRDCHESKHWLVFGGVLYMLGSSTGGSKVTDEVYTGFVRSWKTWKSQGILKWSFPGLEKSWKKT